MKGSSLAGAGVVVGLVCGVVAAMGLPRAGAQGSEAGSARQSSGLMALLDVANASSGRHRSTDFDLLVLSETDRPIGRLSLTLAAVGDLSTGFRFVHHVVETGHAMDIRTITYHNMSEMSYIYVFDEFDPDNIGGSIQFLRAVVPLIGPVGSGVVQLDPPVRLRKGDVIAGLVRTQLNDEGVLEFCLLGTTPFGGGGDVLVIE